MKFQKLQSRPDLPELEERVISYWKEHEVLDKYLHRNDDSDDRFTFIDGPVTANNPMGVHHARGRALKDLVQRFKNMKGYKQRFQNGFDCQGLWVEVEVEKSLGFNSKKDIEDYGLARFTNACKDRVRRFAEKITNQSKRLGYFMDWDNSYFTMSERNNLHIWYFLKKCQEKDLLYKSESSTTWCPRCETGLSKHEQADGYKTIHDTSVYVKFPIKENEYLLAWTTTPWTLPANVLLAVNPELNYVRTEKDGEVFYVEEDRVGALGLPKGEVVDTSEIVGLEYTAPFDGIPAQDEAEHRVVEWNLAEAGEGTGIVHVAPGCGEEDFQLGKELGVSIISPLDETGHFQEGYGDLNGMYAHDVDEQVFDHLEERNLLFKKGDVTHSYPHCWRCKTKCLFRTEKNWFIRVKDLARDMKEASSKVNWIPGYVEKRMEDWLENMGDWMISRRRFYGLSLPFYECSECDSLTVVESKEELKEFAINPEEVDALPSLHRPWIDKVQIKCSECGEIVSRIEDVGDCWLDAGVVPFSTLNYLTDKSYWERWFPANFISEMIEQVRLWYYSMLVYGVVLEGEAPYEAVLNYDEVRDEKGQRMSKSKGNGIPYDEAVSEMGADTMRWLYFTKNPNAPVNFGYNLARKVRRGFLGTLWNSYRFFLGFASIERDPESFSDVEFSSENILDRWIVSRLQLVIGEMTEKLDNYDSARASNLLEDFVVKDLSLWYIRRSRDRVGPQAVDGDDKDSCYDTFYLVLKDLARLLAPFIPFMTEKLWYSLRSEDSVHLEDWPESDRRLRDEELEEQMGLVRDLASLAHSIRKKEEIRTRQPLSELQVDVGTKELSEDLLWILADELNVEDVLIVDSVSENWSQATKNDLTVALKTKVTPELKEKGLKREVVRRVQYLRKKASLTPADQIRVRCQTDSQEISDLISNNSEWIAEETIATDVEVGTLNKDSLITKETKVGGEPVEISLYK